MARSIFTVAVVVAFAFAMPAPSGAQTPLPPPGSTTQPVAPPRSAPRPLPPPRSAQPPAQPVQPDASAPAAGAAAAPTPPDPDEVGNVASLKGGATVIRKSVSSALKVQDPIFKGDTLRTAANGALGITFDDETTFNLSANATITVDDFIYKSTGKKNSALFKIARGTVAFAANQVAKTGDMKITTPSSTLGIRGTSGVVEVPEGATPGTAGEVAVKLYADQDGRVGRIELLGDGGAQLGLLTRAATGFTLRAGGPQRFTAVPLTIPPQQIARDRAFVQRAFAARAAARPMIQQRRNLRSPNPQRQPNLRQPGQRQGQPRQGTQPNQPRQGSAQPGQPRQGGTQPGLPRQGAAPQNQPDLQRNPNVQRTPALQRSPGGAAPRQPARRKQPGNTQTPR